VIGKRAATGLHCFLKLPKALISISDFAKTPLQCCATIGKNTIDGAAPFG
jgi:hypothetical protein